eukprot:1178063-Prorocentrum_minimum.AAC.5
MRRQRKRRSRRAASSRSVTCLALQSLSATAPTRGNSRGTRLLASTHSPHMTAVPPSTKAFCASVPRRGQNRVEPTLCHHVQLAQPGGVRGLPAGSGAAAALHLQFSDALLRQLLHPRVRRLRPHPPPLTGGRAILPHVDRRVVVHRGFAVERILPHDGALARLVHCLQGQEPVVVLQELEGLHVVLHHPFGHIRVGLPALQVHLVHAHVQLWVWEHEGQLADEVVQRHAREVTGRIHRAPPRRTFPPHAVGVEALGEQLRVPPPPRARVARGVELRHHPDAPQPRALHHLAHCRGAVRVRRLVCAVLVQAREGGALVGEAFVVREVPVEHVQLRVAHPVQHLQQRAQRQEVPRRVQQHPTEGEPGGVVDARLPHAVPGATRLCELREGLQPTHGTVHAVRLEERRGREDL